MRPNWSALQPLRPFLSPLIATAVGMVLGAVIAFWGFYMSPVGEAAGIGLTLLSHVVCQALVLYGFAKDKKHQETICRTNLSWREYLYRQNRVPQAPPSAPVPG